tara:strand:- start:2861 stop:4279 length:1419 start_codon:yes stop_codon:yes gene_type:complete
MKLIDKHKSQRRKQEIVKPGRSNQPLACQTLAFFPTLGLTVIVLTLSTLTSFGQIQAPKTPTLENNFPKPFTTNPNNNLTPNQLTQNQEQLNQYQKDIQKQQRQRQELEAIYREISQPKKPTTKTTVNYDLPSCDSVSGTSAYRSAFTEISKMTDGQKTFNLSEANFLVENAFYENQAQFEQFNKTIQQIGQFLTWKMEELNYDQSSNLAKNLILYRFFSDTLEIKSKNLKHLPFKYDFDDYMGNEDWTKMFVEKALATNSGQCHSLPLLYLILAEEIGAKAQLAYSPSHSYVKFQDDNGKWHNIELTNGMMTTDAFVLQSGYIKAEALQNEIYMLPLNQKELLSHVLFDLAKGYAVKYCYDSFVKQVIDKALEIDPNNINAHMVKSDYRTMRFMYVQKQLNVSPDNIDKYPKAKQLLNEMYAQYDIVDNLGFEQMPAEAYEKWLGSLQNAKQKQESQKMIFKLNQDIELKR